MKLHFRTRLYTGFAIAILLSAVSGLTCYFILQKQQKQQVYVRSARSVLDSTTRIQSLLVDMETGRRGFRATNQKRFLQPYYDGLSHINPTVTALKGLLADDTELGGREFVLEQHIDTLLKFWDKIGYNVDTFSKGHVTNLTDTEKKQMDEIRSIIASLQKDESKLLSKRRDEYEELVHYGTLSTSIDSIISEVIIIILIFREFKTRRKAQEQLKQSVVQLEEQADELKKSETELKNAMDELGKINKQLEKFVYTVAHDVKSPLSGIISALSLIQADETVAANEEVSELATLSFNAAWHLSDMVHSLLEYSRLSITNKLAEEVDTKELLEQMAVLLFPPKNIHIQVAGDMPVFNTFKLKIQQVFQNLITNAIKYNGKENGIIEIGHKDKGEFYEFFVKDNGQGIEGEDKHKIFALMKTGGNRSSVDSSTGFGLNIVKLIVEEQGGKIWYDTVIGQGSTFYFEWKK
jgi:signal transduction histidine kinase